MGTTTTRSTKRRPPEPPIEPPTIEPPIPAWAIVELEEKLGRSLEGWEQKEPRYHSPAPVVEGGWFDVAAVVHVVDALRRMPHTKGRWARAPFEPETWQIMWIIAPVFGWKHADGTRIARELWDELARKGGKSSLISRLLLVLATADGEMGGEVYALATSTDQARQVFGEGATIARRAPLLRRRSNILTSVIRFPRTGGIFRVLSRVAETAHGLNVSGAGIDEVWAHKSRDLIDAIETGTAARAQPLILFITTAGSDDETTIYAEKHNDAVAIAKGETVDPSVWVVIWCAEKTDDPFLEATWAKANPNYPISPTHEYLTKKAEKAKRTPTFLPTFLRLHLNIRSDAIGEVWPGADHWPLGAGIVVEDKLKGRKAWGGLVAASATDLSAIAWCFPNPEGEGVWALWRYFLPEESLPSLDERTGGHASQWVKSKKLVLTEGNVIDIQAHVEQILADCRAFDAREFAYDPNGAIGIVQPLIERKAVTVVPVYATTPGAVMIDWERLVASKQFNHGGNPVTAWSIRKVVVTDTGAGVWKIARKASRDNVAGPAAAELALRRLLVGKGAKPKTLRGASF